MAFDSNLRHFRTIAEFTAYLQGVPRPAWAKGLTNHNTYIPDERTWRGMASMSSMRDHYIALGWSAGPHLFLAAAAPNPADTGIFQLTPISHVGVHAGACNASHVGIESVGNFQDRPPTDDQYTLLIAVNRAILEHWRLPPEAVNVHNECMAGRTCPGKYLTGTQIRADLSMPLIKRYRARRMMISTVPEFQPPWAGELLPGEEVVIDKWYSHMTGHLADHRGFVRLADLEPL